MVLKSSKILKIPSPEKEAAMTQLCFQAPSYALDYFYYVEILNNNNNNKIKEMVTKSLCASVYFESCGLALIRWLESPGVNAAEPSCVPKRALLL